MALQRNRTEQAEPARPGSPDAANRTVTPDDDLITRTMARLPMNAALAVAGLVYAGIGLALPLAIGAPDGSLIGLNIIGVMIAWALTLGWLFPVTEARARRQLLEQSTNLRLLSARDFEQLVGEMLRREGWEVKEVGQHGTPDGGVDLQIREGTRRMLVQCKRWDSKQVGVNEVRQLAGAMLREKVNEGVLVTLSDFTPASISEAKKDGIILVAGSELARRLERTGATKLLRDDTRDIPYACPQCGTPMRLGHNDYGYWLSCPNFATDRGKLDLGPDPTQALERLIRSR
jgi:hypothetical protein